MARFHHTCFSPSPNTKYTEGKKKKTSESGSAAEHSSDTLFVSNLPFPYSNSQLEETLSDVGPIRRSFMGAQKGRKSLRIVPKSRETFGPEHQLISSFALGDVQILKLLKAKLSNSAAGNPLRFSRYAGKGFPEKGHPELRIDQ
ncbi:RNA-binding protein [Salix suchowensis]|nr:RNA-binding protein [Salix suchowensis]